MRKRYLYIIVATVVAALASACMKDEADKPVISFSPVASKATKAIISGNDYPTGESFVVSAYHDLRKPVLAPWRFPHLQCL